LREVLANIVNERTAASPLISMAVFKLQLMCRKQNSIVRRKKIKNFSLRTNINISGSFTIKS
jgi:hypothetical protein